MVELPSGADLQNDVDVSDVVKAAVHLDDVGVVEEHLDLHLPYELLSDLLLVQQLLLDHLQGANEATVLLLYQIHPPVLAVPQLLDPHKVVDCDLAALLPAASGPVGQRSGLVALESRLDNLGPLHFGPVSAEERGDLHALGPVIEAILFEEVGIFMARTGQLLPFGREHTIGKVVNGFAHSILLSGHISQYFYLRVLRFFGYFSVILVANNQALRHAAPHSSWMVLLPETVVIAACGRSELHILPNIALTLGMCF